MNCVLCGELSAILDSQGLCLGCSRNPSDCESLPEYMPCAVKELSSFEELVSQ